MKDFEIQHHTDITYKTPLEPRILAPHSFRVSFLSPLKVQTSLIKSETFFDNTKLTSTKSFLFEQNIFHTF